MTDPGHVLVTGASGYIAKHIVLRLLDAGMAVTGSVRTISRADEGWRGAFSGIDAWCTPPPPFR